MSVVGVDSGKAPALKVAVVGAGVIGLSAALHLVEKFPGLLEVTIIADRFTPDTTSDKSSALMKPTDFYTGSPEDSSRDPAFYQKDLERWSRETMSRFCDMYHSVENNDIQFLLTSGYQFLSKEIPDPWWKDIVFGFRHVELGSREATTINTPPECKQIWCYSTFTIDPSTYLQWMQKQFVSRGGKIEKRRISSLEELSDSFNIVINCTGVWAGHLVPENNMEPVRGQAVVVRAPWVSHFIIDHREDGELTYFFPRATSVIMGGTLETGNWSEEIDDHTTEDILARCAKFQPSLSTAEVVKISVGLRPLRSQVRLDTAVGVKGGLVIHCYGHGGQGIALSWGCVIDIGNIVQKQVQMCCKL